ncbi:MAG: methyltransferase domain-containing protein [Pseudomonadota bacterium]
MSHEQVLAANPANAPTARFLTDAGIAAGMRVLDIGCGNGDVSRLVAALAGPDGEVVAIDRSDDALAMARAADAAPGAAPIHYRAVDLASDLPDLGTFDAIVGRRVLMYLPDAAATLTRLAALARPGAILAFQEHARANLPTGLGPLPLHRQLYDWMWRTIAAEKGDVGLALRLSTVMRDLGLSIEIARGEAILFDPGTPSFLPILSRVMLPRLVALGVATAEEIDSDTLAERVEREREAVGGTIVWDLAFLVSARTARA